MTKAPCASAALLLASLLASQQPAANGAADERPLLQFATVLERGNTLLPPPPKLQWLPTGHDAVVVLPGERTEVLHRVAPGKAPRPWTDARAAMAAIGRPIAADAPAVFPAFGCIDDQTLRFELADSVFHWQPAQPHATAVLSWPVADQRDSPTIAVAPGDRHAAVIHDHDLWVVARDAEPRRITFDGGPDIVYGGAAHRAEFGIGRGLFWSPDGRFLACYREDQRGVAAYPFVDTTSRPPRPLPFRYPMAGEEHAHTQVGIYDTETLALRWLPVDGATDRYWTNLTYHPDSRSLVVALLNRAQDRLELAQYSLPDGALRGSLLQQQDGRWLEPEHGPTFVPDGRFLWWSSQSGHRHLWLHAADGKVLRQVTKGAFDVQQLLGLNADGSGLWFVASGEDPRQRHLFFARLDGKEVRQVTRERGSHDASLSADRQHAFVVWSNLETAPQLRFLDLQSGAIEPLPSPPQPMLAWRLPQHREFQVKTDDGTVLYGSLLMPPSLVDGHRYPVLLYVYGGPHVQMVLDRWLGGAAPWQHALANEGILVCRLDNRGTPNRGIEFEQSLHRRLGQVEVEDQLRAVAWLKQQPFVDPGRIAVHGWSYGGYLTLRLLLQAPDQFACGVSGAPVTDWSLYETGYTERYMGTPAGNPDGYRTASCLPLAEQLRAKLLLVHGTDDRTVLPAHSFAFAERLVRSGMPFEFLPYPMQRHRLDDVARKHFLAALRAFLQRELKVAG